MKEDLNVVILVKHKTKLKKKKKKKKKSEKIDKYLDLFKGLKKIGDY